MKVRTITKHPYKGIEYHVGDEYEMENQDVEIMTQAGNITCDMIRRDIQNQGPKKYQRRDMKAN